MWWLGYVLRSVIVTVPLLVRCELQQRTQEIPAIYLRRQICITTAFPKPAKAASPHGEGDERRLNGATVPSYFHFNLPGKLSVAYFRRLFLILCPRFNQRSVAFGTPFAPEHKQVRSMEGLRSGSPQIE